MGILRQILDYLRYWLTIANTQEENKQEIKELRQEVEQLTEFIWNFANEMRFALNDERHEREKLMLKLENEMLKFERRLPPGKTKDEE